jgi:integrase
VRNIHTTLRKAFADAVDARRLDFNPAEAAKLPRLDTDRETTVWTPAQVASFLTYVAEDRIAALYVVAATTGMRRGELRGVRWQDVAHDAAPPRLSVRRSLVQYGKLVVEKEPKTGRSRRTIALDATAVIALRRYRLVQAQERLAAGAAYTETDVVFTDEIGRSLSPSAVSAAFRRHVKAAKLPPITLHGLRHTFATLGLEAGVDTLYVSEILGHSSAAITMGIYQHTREDRLAAAVTQVSDAIFSR